MIYINIRISSAITHFKSLFVFAFSFIKMLILGVIFIWVILIYINESNFQDRLDRASKAVIFIDGLNKCLGTYC
jgi:hypothetical protein